VCVCSSPIEFKTNNR